MAVVAETPRGELSGLDVDRVIDRVATVRRLPPLRSLRIASLPEDEFRAALHRGSAQAKHSDQSALAWGLSFNFLPPAHERAGASSAQEADDAVLAFYDIERDIVVMPAPGSAEEARSPERAAILAHEVQHALVAQHFSAEKPAGLGMDARIAHEALHEGDAMVAMGGFVAHRAGVPVRRALRQMTEWVDDVDRRQLASKTELGAFDRSLPIVQARMQFPYEEGMRFVVDIYRAGGFDLVNRMYQDPPSTTEQILHPQKYLDGELAVAVRELPSRPGYRMLTSGTLGAMQTGVLLRACEIAGPVHDPALGWGGDRYSILERDGQLVLAWATAWDTEADATAFERRMQRSEGCLGQNAASDLSITGSVEVRRNGHKVAIVRGAQGSAEGWLDALLASVGAAPVREPISDVRVPPRVPLPSGARGKVHGRDYDSPWLGLTTQLPQGVKWSTADDDLELSFVRPGLFGGLVVSERIVDPEVNELTFRELETVLERAVGVRLVRDLNRVKRTPLGRVHVRGFRAGRSGLVVRSYLVPICAGTGSLLFVVMSTERDAAAELRSWFSSARFSAGRNLPVCERLNPE